MSLDLSIDTSRLFYPLLKMICWMLGAGILYVMLIWLLPKRWFNKLLSLVLIVVLAGVYGYFKFNS